VTPVSSCGAMPPAGQCPDRRTAPDQKVIIIRPRTPVLCQNSFVGASHGVSRSLSRSAVLVNQTAKDLPALDPGGDIDGLAELPLRRFLPQSLVRPMAVIVPGVLSQNPA
jgi:hypothetical protein